MNNLDYFKKFNKPVKEQETNNRVWVYTRVSSKEQFDKNGSLDHQKKEAQLYAKNNNYFVDESFGGTYESAKGDFTRTEFMKLITKVKESTRKPFAILIYKVNRFSRSGGNAIVLLEELIHKHGVHLIEVHSGKNTTTQSGEYDITNLLLQAKHENLSRLESTIPGMKAFIRKGNWLGSAPKGYTLRGKRVQNELLISGKQQIDINNDGKLLKKAWQWKLAGERDIDIKNNLKLKGLTLSKQFMSQMWRKPFYCGISNHAFLDGDVIKGNWRPIVPTSDFKVINKRLDEGNVGYIQSKEPIGRPLQSQLFCGNCGTKMTGYVKKKTIHYYKCQNKKCTCKDLNANSSKRSIKEGLHNIFKEYLTKFELNPALLAVFRAQMKLTIENQNQEEIEFMEDFKLKEKELDNRLTQLEEKYLFDGFPKEKYESYKNKIVAEISELNKEKAKIDFEISNLDKSLDFCISLIQNISDNWASGSYKYKSRLQKLIFPQGFFIEPENRQYRTSKTNNIFLILSAITSEIGGNEKDSLTKNVNESSIVAGTGLEPVTFGL
jgi:site-specific DNA recombinase